ncbi:MAG: 4Fe-4S dicluster domain-containing protein [Thermoguttaceae bacterium]|jgi:ferredoxin
MPHVVCEPCYGCKYTDCAPVCPVEAFREGDMMLYIDPEACIDCEACVSVCPVEAIFSEDQVPEKWQSYIEINAQESPRLPMINQQKKPLK